MEGEAQLRTATVRTNGSLEPVGRFLPDNYKVVGWGKDEDGPYVLIEGRDVAGWTLEDYVIPRLASGLYWCQEREER